MDIVLESFCDTLRGTSSQDPREVLTKYGPQLNKILGERTGKIVERVKADGAKFLQDFMDKNEGSIKTDSGLLYHSSRDGQGTQPTLANTVEVHYHGTLTDGTVFDSSVDRGQTISFPLGGVIKVCKNTHTRHWRCPSLPLAIFNTNNLFCFPIFDLGMARRPIHDERRWKGYLDYPF